MKQFILAIVFLSIFFCANSQIKYNSVVARKIADPGAQNELLPLLIRGNIASIRILTEQAHGILKFYAGDIASVEIPVKNIPTLIQSNSIQRIEGNNAHLKLMNDSVRVNNNINEVHAGLTPLPQGYDGSGTVMGIIDSGIDFLHPDFRDSIGGQSVTRVKYLWDQNLNSGGTTPLPFNYGQEWNNLQIDSGKAGVHGDETGHGTHVTGVAAGNGKGANVNKGVAPGSDLVIVGMNFNNPTGFMLSDAVNYIYSKAQALGKPCVINISIGDYYGSHDGKNMEAQLIKNLITQQNGRSLVAAAGNLGGLPFHLGYTVTADTNFTWFKPDPALGGGIRIEVWGDTNDLKNIKFAIGADRVTPNYFFKGNTPFKKITSNLGMWLTDTLKSGGKRLGFVDAYGDLNGSTYEFIFEIHPDSALFNWRLMTTGIGKFDVWNINFSNYLSGMVYNNIPPPSVLPDSAYYKYPDAMQTIVSSFQCLDEVITVGNYYNRNTHLNCVGNIYTDTTITPGSLSVSSSAGPTRDLRIKPDITSTGNYTMASGPAWVMAAVVPTVVCTTHVAFGNLHFRDGGTSNASPVVAGIAALYLQRFPTASYQDIKNAILYCAKQDTFTGTALPNNTWGYGKANAFLALQNCYSGVTDVSPERKTDVKVYPNPFQNSTTIMYSFSENKNTNVQLIIYNSIGAKIKLVPINNSIGSIAINRNDMPNGVYFYTMISNNEILASGKMVTW